MAQTQRTARSWLFVLGLLWLAFFGAVVIVMVTQGTGPLGALGVAPEEDDEDVAVVNVDGWFTEEQAGRGGEDYAQYCAQCHGDQLEGGVAPALAGDTFWQRWEGDTVHSFFEVTRQTMPQDAPGSLEDETYADITAFVLQVNEFPEGDEELPPDEERLQELAIDRAATEEVAEGPDEPAVGEADMAEEPEADPDAEPEAADPDEPEEAAEAEAEPDAEEPEFAEAEEDGWFSEAHVRAGEDAFQAHCARCHGADLRGDPPLIGGGFPERYNTVWELYEYTRQVMPLDAPGSLDRRTYLDAVAYVVHENGYPLGDERVQPLRAQLERLEFDPELAGDPPGEGPYEEEPEEPANDEPDEPANDEPVPDEADADANDEAADDEAEEADPDEPDAEEPQEAEPAAEEPQEPEPDEEAADGPGPGRAWLEIDTQPANVTINIVGPDGFARRAIGAQTLRDLRPGTYVVAASRGHESAVATVVLESEETGHVSLVLDELSRSGDVPEEPAVHTTEMPAIPLEPDEDALVGELPDAPAEAAPEPDEAESEEPANDEPDEPANDEPVPDEADADANDEAADDEAGNDDPAADGWFTDEQAERGEGAYQQHCAQCHGDDLQGDPPLVGDAFHDSFDTVWELYDYTRTEMPQDDPGSLDDETYADIIAFVLRENDFPAGDEELEPDAQDAMEDMPLDPDEAENGEPDEAEPEAPDADEPDAVEPDAVEPEPAEPDDPEREAEDPEADGREEATLMAVQEPRETGPAVAPGDQLQSERGFHAYALHCARCHGENREGNVAPALGGPVFMERWGGHPVDWLYFQARASMPPHGPGFLAEQVYADIIVYALTESGVLEGHEEYRPHDEAFRTLVIRPMPLAEDRPDLEERVDRLRDAIHVPHDDDGLPVAEPIAPIEWPDDPGAAPIGPPGRTDAAVAFEGEQELEEAEEEDDEDDDGASRNAPAVTIGAR